MTIDILTQTVRPQDDEFISQDDSWEGKKSRFTEENHLSDSDLSNYLKAGADKCHRCGSKFLIWDDVLLAEQGAEANVVCNKCGLSWIEKYTLTAVYICEEHE